MVSNRNRAPTIRAGTLVTIRIQSSDYRALAWFRDWLVDHNPAVTFDDAPCSQGRDVVAFANVWSPLEVVDL